MNNDPLLQELLAEFDKLMMEKEAVHLKQLIFNHPNQSYTLVIDVEKIKSFFTSAVLRIRERTLKDEAALKGARRRIIEQLRAEVETEVRKRTLDEAVAAIPNEWPPMEPSCDCNMCYAFNKCRAATLEALNALREANPSTP